MKTVKQIIKKADNYRNKLKAAEIVENFGNKEQRLLAEYIGDEYLYAYNDQLTINSIQHNFNEWCMNYTGQ